MNKIGGLERKCEIRDKSMPEYCHKTMSIKGQLGFSLMLALTFLQGTANAAQSTKYALSYSVQETIIATNGNEETIDTSRGNLRLYQSRRGGYTEIHLDGLLNAAIFYGKDYADTLSQDTVWLGLSKGMMADSPIGQFGGGLKFEYGSLGSDSPASKNRYYGFGAQFHYRFYWGRFFRQHLVFSAQQIMVNDDISGQLSNGYVLAAEDRISIVFGKMFELDVVPFYTHRKAEYDDSLHYAGSIESTSTGVRVGFGF